MKVNLSKLTTEQVNEETKNIDRLSTVEMVTLMNKEDGNVINAVNAVLPEVAGAIDIIYQAFKKVVDYFMLGLEQVADLEC